MRRLLVALTVVGVCVASADSYASGPTRIWIQPVYQGPILNDLSGNGVIQFDVVIDSLAGMNRFALWGIVTRGGAESTDLIFDHADVSANLVSIVNTPVGANGPWKLTDTGGSTGDAMIGRSISSIPDPMGQSGPTVTGQIASFFYKMSPAAHGQYKFALDQTWQETGDTFNDVDVYTTKSYLAKGTGMTITFVPKKYAASVEYDDEGNVVPESIVWAISPRLDFTNPGSPPGNDGSALVEIEVPGLVMLTVVNGTGSGEYYIGTAVPIQAEIPPGYRFDRWISDTGTVADVYSPSTTITMAADCVVTATFVRQFTLEVVNGSGSGTYDIDTVVPVAANLPSGFRFEKWVGDTANVADVWSVSTTIAMLDDAVLTAVFVQQFRLTVVGGAGSGIYDIGAVVPIAADLPAGYRFDKWTGDTADVADVQSVSTTIGMHADCVVTARIVQQFTISVLNGTGSGTYDIGTIVAITADVPAGYRFDRWVGDTANIAEIMSASTTMTMLQDAFIEAAFVQQCTLVVFNGTGSAVYDIGTVVPIQASIPAGYGFDKWTGDSVNVAKVDLPTTTITMRAHAVITATFKLGSIAGTVWHDLNENRVRDGSEQGLGPCAIYLDQNHNGRYDEAERVTFTDTIGGYCFAGLFPGDYMVAELTPPTFVQTFPGNPSFHSLSLGPGQAVQGINFGNRFRQPGDMDGDGCVNVVDLIMVRNRLGQGSCR